MKFTPNYTVSYKGAFHPAGKAFDIDTEDAAEMQQHGKIDETPAAEEAPKRRQKTRNKKG